LLFVLTSFFTSPLDRPSQPPLETRDNPSLCTCFPFRPLDDDFLPSYVALARWTQPRVRELRPPLHPTVADFGFLGQRPWVRTMPIDLARTPSRRTEPFPAPPSCCLSSDLPNRAQPISPLLLRIIIGNFFSSSCGRVSRAHVACYLLSVLIAILVVDYCVGCVSRCARNWLFSCSILVCYYPLVYLYFFDRLCLALVRFLLSGYACGLTCYCAEALPLLLAKFC
jgi:hypothetical protein